MLPKATMEAPTPLTIATTTASLVTTFAKAPTISWEPSSGQPVGSSRRRSRPQPKKAATRWRTKAQTASRRIGRPLAIMVAKGAARVNRQPSSSRPAGPPFARER
jgi:hypothetical protein